MEIIKSYMIKNFQLLIHQVLDSVELNEKAFRDFDSGFVVLGSKIIKE